MSTASDDSTILEFPAPEIALLRLNRPQARNALNGKLRVELAEHFRALGQQSDVRVIVLTGNEQAFAAGADLKEFAEAGAAEMYLRHVENYWAAIARCPKPVIAAVNGYALGGGCELAMHCDLIIAGQSARFAQPEIKVGLMPGAGGTQRLVRAVGKFQAMRMVLTGCVVSGPEALAMGLVSEVVTDDQVLPRALEMAADIARMPPIAVQQIKEVLLAGMDMPLEGALTLERKAFQLLFDTKDQKEGMRAFFEKRQPEYKGE